MKLTLAQIASYKTLINDKPTKLSPLPGLEAQAGNDKADIPKDAAPMLKILANTIATAHLNYRDRSISADKAVYYSDNTNTNGVMLSATKNSILMQSPPDTDNILKMIMLSMGDSQLDPVDINLSLPLTQAATFFALIDARRQQKLSELAGEKQKNNISMDDIKTALTQKSHILQWLAPAYIKALGKGLPPKKNILSALEKLEKKQLITKKDNTLIAGNAIENMADHFLLLETHMRLRSSALDKTDNKNSSDIHIVRGRANTIFSWSINKKTVELRSLSPAQLLMLVELIMRPSANNTPPIDKPPTEKATQAETSSAQCQNCNAELIPDDKFCNQCGATI